MTDPELYRTAIHEAGHAVAFLRLFPDRYGFDVKINLDNESRGSVNAEDVSYVDFDCSDEDANRHFLNRSAY